MGQQVNQNKIISPCVGVCEIDVQSQLCIGCLRSTDEIAMWPQIDYEKSLEVMNQIAKRSISKN